ncbi:MAG: hypothetical protein WKG07_41835 [Hymenobacter sp.]
MLTCALAEHLLHVCPTLTTLHLRRLRAGCGRACPTPARPALAYLGQWLAARGITLHARLHAQDFISATAEVGRAGLLPRGSALRRE